MQTLPVFLVVFLNLIPSVVTAGELNEQVESKIEIRKPSDGDVIRINKLGSLDYTFTLAGDDDHAYVYIDGVRTQKLRQPIGSYPFERMSLGEHEICLQTFDKHNTSPGAQRCIKIKISTPSNCTVQCI